MFHKSFILLNYYYEPGATDLLISLAYVFYPHIFTYKHILHRLRGGCNHKLAQIGTNGCAAGGGGYLQQKSRRLLRGGSSAVLGRGRQCRIHGLGASGIFAICPGGPSSLHCAIMEVSYLPRFLALLCRQGRLGWFPGAKLGEMAANCMQSIVNRS